MEGIHSFSSSHSTILWIGNQIFGWGRNQNGQLCLPDGDQPNPTRLEKLEKLGLVAISSGYTYTYGLTDKAELYSFRNDSSHKITFPNLPKEEKIVQIACGDDFSSFLTDKGNIYNFVDEEIYSSFNCTPFKNQVKFKLISCGDHHALAISEDNQVYGWGKSGSYQLATNIDQPSPVPIEGLPQDSFVDLITGGFDSMAKTKSGHYYSWGSNTYGQLGTGTKGNLNTPQRAVIFDSYKIKRIILGCNHSLILTEDGSLYGMGDHSLAQLGIGTKTGPFSDPVQIHALSHKKVKDMFCGRAHSVAITEDNEIWSWGFDSFKSVGRTSGTNPNLAEKLPINPKKFGSVSSNNY